MSFFLQWLPTLIATAILAVAAFLVDPSIYRNKRRDSAHTPRAKDQTSSR